MKYRILALLLAAGMLLALTACGGAVQSAPAEDAPEQAEASAPEEAAAPEAAPEPEAAAESGSAEEISAAEEAPVEIEYGEVTYPVFEDTQDMSIFGSASAQFLGSVDMSLYSQTAAVQALEEATGVRLDYSSMTNDDVYQEKLTLMIASGAAGLLEEDVCIDIAPYLDEHAPDLKRLLDEDTEYAENVYTDNGELVGVKMRAAPTTDGGGIIRQDWLDAVGMDMPQTYDQMHDVMAAFQSQFGATDPYIMPYQVLSPWGVMAGGYGISATADANNIIVNTETGKVELATISDAYYDYLCMFRDWYNEGLINHDFTSQTMNLPDQTIISNEMAGIWFSDQGYIKTYQDLLAEVNPDATLSLMAQPGKDEARSGYIASTRSVAGSGGFSISESCDDIELAMKWCDIWYNPDLTQFINYGYEGETFEYDENGKPVLGGIITNNDLGLPSLRMSNGVFLCTSGGFIYDRHKFDMEYNELQLAAYTEWIAKADDPSTVKTSGLPTGAKMNVAEADTVATAMSDITTHVAEMALKFVTGATELNEQNYAQYVSEIEGMRLQEALDAVQSAYDRYLENIE